MFSSSYLGLLSWSDFVLERKKKKDQKPSKSYLMVSDFSVEYEGLVISWAVVSTVNTFMTYG